MPVIIAESWYQHPGVWLAAVAGGFLLFLFIVSLVERNLVVPYLPVDPYTGRPLAGFDWPPGVTDVPHPSQVSNYTMAMAAEAPGLGYEYGGVFVHAKLPMIRVVGLLYWTPDRRVLMSAASGTVARMASQQTWLFTPLADGRYLATTDCNNSGDHSGTLVVKRVLNVPLPKLHAAHAGRVQRHHLQARPFPDPSAFDAVCRVHRGRAERMTASGVARYTDPARAAWRYTATGAARVVLSFFGQFGNALTQFWRVNRKPIASPQLNPLGTLRTDAGAGP